MVAEIGDGQQLRATERGPVGKEGGWIEVILGNLVFWLLSKKKIHARTLHAPHVIYLHHPAQNQAV